MRTEKEKHGISELLSRMAPRDLNSLAQTVTSRLIVPETSSEAVSAILLHTDKPADLLRRRKIKKELLFKYLHAKRVTADPQAEKAVFISHVLQLWGNNHGISGEFKDIAILEFFVIYSFFKKNIVGIFQVQLSMKSKKTVCQRRQLHHGIPLTQVWSV